MKHDRYAAQAKGYSLTLDPAGIRALTADAITGALAFGYQGVNPPPDGDHWLAPFWEIGRESADKAQQPVSGADELAELLSLLREIRPSHGDVGTRDVDVTAQQARIDRAIALLSQPQPSGNAGELQAATDGGRNMLYEGQFEGETERERAARLVWADDMRGAFERHTGNAWFDKDWKRDTALWAACWRAAQASGQDREDADRLEWMADDNRAPWAINSLKDRIKEMRASEKRCRDAFRKDYMRVVSVYFADALGEAARALEKRLSAIDRARRIEGGGE